MKNPTQSRRNSNKSGLIIISLFLFLTLIYLWLINIDYYSFVIGALFLFLIASVVYNQFKVKERTRNEGVEVEDYLGFRRFVDPLSKKINEITSNDRSLTIGVYGEWGSGKTRFLELLSETLSNTYKITPIWFNAWKYDKEDNLWSALLQAILTQIQINGDFWQRLRIKFNIWINNFSPDIGFFLSRTLLLLLRLVVVILCAGLLIGWKSQEIEKILRTVFSNVPTHHLTLVSLVTRSIIAFLGIIASKPDSLLSLFSPNLGIDFSKLKKKNSYRDHIAFLDDFSVEFKKIVRMATVDKPLVVIVDDLDRCLPEKAIEILEAIKKFLDADGCVFILALDHEFIEKSVCLKYKELFALDQSNTSNFLSLVGLNYLEKIIQLPVSVPKLNDKNIRDLIENVYKNDTDVQKCIPIFMSGLPHNPRKIQIIIEIFRYLKALAEEAGYVLKMPLLAKLIILENQFRNLYQLILEDNSVLPQLEQYYISQAGNLNGPEPFKFNLRDQRANEEIERIIGFYKKLKDLMLEGGNDSSFLDISLEDYIYFIQKGASESPSILTAENVVNVQDAVTIQFSPGIGNTQQTYLNPDPLPPSGILPEPGPQRPGWYLPIPRNSVFIGRAADLLALADSLLYHPQVGVTAVTALKGEGGIGKSQLAVEFAYRYGRCFHSVHWIPSGEMDDIASGIAACGAQMGLPGWPERDVERQVDMTLNAWAETPQRFVILDNLEDPEKLREWLPRLGACRLLITTRRGNWPAELGVRGHALGVLPPDEARALLRKLAPRLEAAPDTDLDALSSHLGGLPLALDLAGRYLEAVGGVSAAAYLGEIQSGGSLKHPSLVDWTRSTPTAHAASLAATFALSWDQLDDESPYDALAQRLFYAAGYCAPNAAIPPELLQKAIEAEDTPTFTSALRRLVDLGLLREGEGGPSLHPLLAEFARLVESPESGALAGLAKALIMMSNAALETGLPGLLQSLHAHLEAAAPLAEAAELEQAGTLWNQLGLCLQQAGQYPAARVCYERALAIGERMYGKDHPQVASYASNLGLVLRAMGDLAGAKALYERALAIDEQVYGKDHPNVNIRASNLGTVLRALGDLAGAKLLYERALTIGEQFYGKDHPQVAIYASNLGLVLYDLGDLAGAKAQIERALAIDERAYGMDHPMLAADASNLGLVLQAMGDLAGAKAQIERALVIDEQVYGKKHPKVASDASNLGLVLEIMSKESEAKVLFQRALEINEQVYGNEHPVVARNAYNLGKVLYKLDYIAGAKAQFERALSIDEQFYGKEHPEVGRDARNLGLALYDLGDLNGAREFLRRALDIFTTFLPPEDNDIQDIRRLLEQIDREMGEV